MLARRVVAHRLLVCFLALHCFLASAQDTVGQADEPPAECLWKRGVCGAIATGENATIYHQVTQNFEACFGATVVKGEYVQRYSGCGEEIPDGATCDSFFAVPLQLCLPSSSNWTTVTELQNVLRLMIECQDPSLVSSRQCDSFRRYLYEGLQCPQCVAPANAVAAASAVCAQLTTPSLCVPEAAIAANFEDYSDLEDVASAPSPDDFVLASGGEEGADAAPLSVNLPGSGLDDVFPVGVPIGALGPDSAEDLAIIPAASEVGMPGPAQPSKVARAHNTPHSVTMIAFGGLAALFYLV